MNQQELEKIIREVVKQAITTESMEKESCCQTVTAEAKEVKPTTLDEFEAEDITAINLQETLYVENPINRDGYMELKKVTPARLGVGRAGARQQTKSLLRFRADHAAAMDAVFSDVDEELIKKLNLVSVVTVSKDKAEYLSNPATGRSFDEANINILKSKCEMNKQIQVIVSDGLSSTAVEANVKDILPALMQGLKGYGLSVGTPVFVKRGRVGAMDSITEILNSDVTIMLVGERPGLVTDESLSCYMTYKGYVGIPEKSRTVISNIYENGTSPSEAGAHIADIAKKMIENKASGMDLKL